MSDFDYDDYLDFEPIDDLYDDYLIDCGGTGCGHCDYCEALIERDYIEEELRNRIEDGDYDDWEGSLTTRFKYPYNTY